MQRVLVTAFLIVIASIAEAGQKVTLMDDDALAAIRSTVSGALAKDHVRELSRMHRVQATAGYHRAAEYIHARASSYGLEDVEIVELPADCAREGGPRTSAWGAPSSRRRASPASP